jgi:hypothetical protein
MSERDYELWHDEEDQAQRPIKSWTKGVPLENEAIIQLRNTASMPFIFRHVAVMPDGRMHTGAWAHAWAASLPRRVRSSRLPWAWTSAAA